LGGDVKVAADSWAGGHDLEDVVGEVGGVAGDEAEAREVREVFVEEVEEGQPSGPPEEDENAEWFEGEILSVKEGFGFIKCEKFPDNVFFHWTSVAGEEIANLVKGDKVNFTVDEGPRGAIARRVELVEE